MGKIRSTKKILDFAPNFYSGVASVLTPGRKSSQLRKIIQLYKCFRGYRGDNLKTLIMEKKTIKKKICRQIRH